MSQAVMNIKIGHTTVYLGFHASCILGLSTLSVYLYISLSVLLEHCFPGTRINTVIDLTERREGGVGDGGIREDGIGE